jgi:hypothetical protein
MKTHRTFLIIAFFAGAWGPPILAQQRTPPDPSLSDSTVYDPFGPENAPDHIGAGSGGVLTPSPYESLIQLMFSGMNADYYGVQYLLDSPLQIAAGVGWTAYQGNPSALLVKVRGTGFRDILFDPLRQEDVPHYVGAFEGSLEYPFRERGIRGYRVRVRLATEPKGLSMAGIGVILSKGNVQVAADRTMDRRLEIEATWVDAIAGYVMPLSPRPGGVNLAVCAGVNLLGLKYQTYYTGVGEFLGAKLGSIGWVVGLGWNAGTAANISGYVGTEWDFSTGGLRIPSNKTVRADVSRTSLYFGLQATGRWFNLVGGIQREWEHLDFHDIDNADKGLRYYVGANFYCRP